ncbi:MAG: radical SAM protein [Bacillota bacterium]
MTTYQYLFGPVSSRRLGLSLGISPIPKKACNYSCVYCQLGPTRTMKRHREMYFPVADILAELKAYLASGLPFDVVSIVGEGEPTLYLGLRKLIRGLKSLTNKPTVVITNGGLLAQEEVKEALSEADIVMPSLDAYDEASFKKINRPLGTIKFQTMYQGLVDFSKTYQGELWLEIMLVKGLNDDQAALRRFKELLEPINYSRLFINSPVRGTAESWVEQVDGESLLLAEKTLGGTSIAGPLASDFYSDIEDDYEAILSIIKRHPMNQHEVTSFLESRGHEEREDIFQKLQQDSEVEVIDRKGLKTYRVV